jgi:hypothetical protein
MEQTIAEIRDEIRAAPVIEPYWLKIPASVRYSSLSRSKIYELIEEGEVRSVCLRSRDKTRGVRLVSRPSLEAYLSKFENTKSEPIPGRKGRKSKKEKEAETR